MYAKYLLLSSAILALTSATQSEYGVKQHTKDYDYDDCDKCLCNKIKLQGPKLVLVNLDNHCEVEDYEASGIYIDVGDQIFIAGRKLVPAGQDWDQFDLQNFDPSIAAIDFHGDIAVTGQPAGTFEELWVLTGVSQGQTTFSVQFIWGGKIVRRVRLDIFVGLCPSVTTCHRKNCDPFNCLPLIEDTDTD